MKTARGIYYNLKDSTYISNYAGLKFFFSSEFYMNKFDSEVEDFILDESFKICTKYNATFNASKMLAIYLYKRIEKRGFRVLLNEAEVKEIPAFNIDIRS